MVKSCIAAGCFNTCKDKVTFHSFPKDISLRKEWTKQVKKTRDLWNGPTNSSVLCSAHFSDKCFTDESNLKSRLQFKHKRRLKPDAVPDVFHRSARSSIRTEVCKESPRRGAFEKRERRRILESIFGAPTISTTPSPSSHDKPTYPDRDENAAINVLPVAKTREIATQTDQLCISVGCQTEQNVRDISVQTRVNSRNKGNQTKIENTTRSISVECSFLEPVPCLTSSPAVSDVEDCDTGKEVKEKRKIAKKRKVFVESESEDDVGDDESDLEFSGCETSSESSIDTSYNSIPDGDSTYLNQRKYIVFEENLMTLFASCPICGIPSSSTVHRRFGTLITIHQVCDTCNFRRKWHSQPFIGDKPAGNILLSSSILFAGASPSKVLRVLNNFNVSVFDLNTFIRHQKYFLQPVIEDVWREEQTDLIEKMKTKERIVIGGDGRADSPGHCAKFGSYSSLELDMKKIVDIQLVQSNEVKSSYHVEKEGLRRSVNNLKSRGAHVDVLVTDRHRSIAKYVREEMTDTTHYYDIWHVAKGLRKKLEGLAKERDCEIVGKWTRSIVNHLYWCAVTTPDGNGDVMLAKWSSIENHIHNVHTGHESPLYPACTHEPLTGIERKKKWLKHGTKASVKLCAIVNSKSLRKDILKLSPQHQTYNVEAFHKVVINFAPKMVAYSYSGMYSRPSLAALHFNENSEKKQARKENGEGRYVIAYPKYKKGGYVVKKVKEKSTFGYVTTLTDRLLDVCLGKKVVNCPAVRIPAPLSKELFRPLKYRAIEEHFSRFNE